MDHRKLLVFLVICLFMGAVISLISDDHYGASTNFKLKWKGVTSTGNETSTSGTGAPTDTIRSDNFVLASSGGQAATVMDDSLYSAGEYLAFPGFLKVYHDWREPISWFENEIVDFDEIASDHFLVEWSGVDTTLEDGQGWGVWTYDVEYKVGSGPWNVWLTGITDTSAEFGPDVPISVVSGEWYHFRVKACDLAQNCSSDWSAFDSVRVMSEIYTVIVQNSFGGGTVFVDGSEYASPRTFGVAPATVIEVSANDTIFEGDTIRHIFIGWDDGGDTTHTITVDSDVTVTAMYETQYRLVVANPTGYDSPDPAPGNHWYTAGSIVCAEVTSPVEDSIYCVGWDGTGSVPTEGTESYFCFSMDSPSTILWQWDIFDDVCTLYVWSPIADPDPIGISIYEVGDTVCCSCPEAYTDTIGHERYENTGWWGSGSVPASGDSNNICFIIGETSHLVWYWNHEDLMPLVIENPDGYGSPAPPEGINWYAYGTDVEANVDPSDGGYCNTGWTSPFGAVPSIGDTNGVEFVIDFPTIIHWEWAPCADLVELTVNSDHGSPYPTVGTSNHTSGTILNIYADVEDTVYDGETRYICIGWEGTGSIPSSGDSSGFMFTITEDSEITWLWRTEHHVQLEYSGCGGAIPALSDSGWFVEDTIINVHAESPIFDGPNVYLFDHWEPYAVVPPDTTDAGLSVDGPYVVVANYSEAYQITLEKDPIEDTLGYFVVDGTDTIWTSDTTLYWIVGSSHSLFASLVDSTDSFKYVFDEWSDGVANGGDRTPTSSTTYTAYYDLYWYTIVNKDPSVDTYGNITIDGVVYSGATSGPVWILDGSSITFEVSTPDVGTGDRFNFIEWNDGYPNPLRTQTVLSPLAFTAYYDHQFLMLVVKDPAQENGDIIIDSVVYEDTDTVYFWSDSADCHTIEVTSPDELAGTSWIFNMWDDTGSSDAWRNDCIYGPVTMVALYHEVSNEIYVLLNHVGRELTVREGAGSGGDSLVWDIDTIYLEEIRSLSEDSVITISNMGQLPIDLGLEIVDISSLWFEGTEYTWTPGVWPGYDRFALSASFTETAISTSIFNVTNDHIAMAGDGSPWATNGAIGGRFGPYGESLAPDSGPYTGIGPDEVRLWLQFRAPFNASVFEDDFGLSMRTITVEMKVRVNLP